MARIATNVPIISILDGQQIKFDEKLATLNSVIMRALLNIPQGEKLSGEDSFKRFNLATKFKDNPGSVDLKSEDIVFIKKVIGEVFGPAIVGPCWDLLEGDSEPEKKNPSKSSKPSDKE